MIRYKAQSGMMKIDTIEVERETDDSVLLRTPVGRLVRRAKRSRDGGYFPTFREAKQCLIDIAEKEIADAEASAEYSRGRLERACGICEPEDGHEEA